MSSIDPNRLRRIVEQAMEIAAPERRDFLLRECGEDAALRSRAEAVLASMTEADSDPIRVGELAAAIREGVERKVAGTAPEALPRELTGTLKRLSKPFEARYELRSKVGVGGMGVVYRAWDRELEREVAVKRLHEMEAPSASTLERFLGEARITSDLQHPGITSVHELGVDTDGRVYFTMPLVEGETLSEAFDHVRRGAPGWNETRVLGDIHKACQAVAFAHERGVAHRDLKPQNIMLGRHGEVFVVDWGIARPDQPAAQGDSPAGTPAYMAPELVADTPVESDERTDVYSMGAILYELLAGRPPYVGDGETGVAPAVLLERLRSSAPVPVARLTSAPAELVAICECAMAREVSRRYATMGELARDLAAYLEVRVVHAHRTGAWAELSKWVARNRLAATLAGGVVASALVGVWQVKSVQAAERLDAQTQVAAKETERLQQEIEFAQRERRVAREHAAELAYRTSEAASQQGRWRQALEDLDEAERLGYPRLPVEVRRADALLAVGEFGRGYEIMERLRSELPPGPQRAAVTVRLAGRGIVEASTNDEGGELIQEALTEGLTGADLEYAKGLVAETTSGSVDAFRRALEVDRFHYLAHSHLLGLLTASGRWKEVREEAQFYATLFPEDPTPIMARAIDLAINAGEASAEHLLETEAKEVMDPVLLEGLSELISALVEIGQATTPDLFIGGQRPDDFFKLFTLPYTLRKALKKIQPIGGPWRFGLSKSGLTRYFDSLISVSSFLAVGNLRRTRDTLEEAVQLHPGAMALYRIAASDFLLSAGSDDIERLRVAERSFRRVLDKPSLFSGVERAARYWIAYSESLLLARGHDLHLRDDLQANLAWFLEIDALDDHEGSMLIHFARRAGEGGLARRLLAKYEDDHGTSADILRTRAALEEELGAWGTAVEAARKLVELEPDDEANQAELARLKLAAREWADSLAD